MSASGLMAAGGEEGGGGTSGASASVIKVVTHTVTRSRLTRIYIQQNTVITPSLNWSMIVQKQDLS